VDGVVIMNYDEHFPGGTPGPVASQDWFTDNLDSAVEEIPKEKLICAIGNYGYDWVERPKKRQASAGRGRQERFRAGSLDRGARFRRRR
jgi:spore germination protein YaaH